MWWRQGELLKKVREGLPDTFRIAYPNTRHSQSQHRKTHRHAVVVIGLDFRAMHRSVSHLESVSFFDNNRSALLQFRMESLHTFTLLHAKTSKIHESLRHTRKR